MNFKTHPKNIEDIQATFDAGYDELYFHGDGNIYTKNDAHPDDPWYDSNFRAGFTNPLPGESPEPHPSTFRVLFKRGDDIPETVEELNEMLLRAKMRQVAKKETAVKTGNDVKVLPAKKKIAPAPIDDKPVLDPNAPEKNATTTSPGTGDLTDPGAQKDNGKKGK